MEPLALESVAEASVTVDTPLMRWSWIIVCATVDWDVAQPVSCTAGSGEVAAAGAGHARTS